jgi:hypothetical protein
MHTFRRDYLQVEMRCSQAHKRVDSGGALAGCEERDVPAMTVANEHYAVVLRCQSIDVPRQLGSGQLALLSMKR